MNDDLHPRKSDVAPALPHLQDGEVDVQKVRMGRWFILRGFKIRKTGRGQFEIESRANPENWSYLYDTETNQCSCFPFAQRGRCPHTRQLAPLLQQL